MAERKDMQGYIQQNQLPEEKAQEKKSGVVNYPDYKGSLTVMGVRIWVSGWIHRNTPEKIAEGKPKSYLSLSLKEAEGGECALVAVPRERLAEVERLLLAGAAADVAALDAAMGDGLDDLPF